MDTHALLYKPVNSKHTIFCIYSPQNIRETILFIIQMILKNLLHLHKVSIKALSIFSDYVLLIGTFIKMSKTWKMSAFITNKNYKNSLQKLSCMK